MCRRAKINLKASNMPIKVIGHFCCRSLYKRTILDQIVNFQLSILIIICKLKINQPQNVNFKFFYFKYYSWELSELENVTCETKYEKVEQIVHDTVYQHTCSEYHVPQCNVTHVSSVKDSSETRCVPSYNTKCKRIKKNEVKKQCNMEYKAECFQVIIQV